MNLQTSLEKSAVRMGENVRLNATVTNKTDQGQPMTLARVGLPGGLTFQTWQLKELRDKGLIAFYETRPREVILYFLVPHDGPGDELREKCYKECERREWRARPAVPPAVNRQRDQLERIERNR